MPNSTNQAITNAAIWQTRARPDMTAPTIHSLSLRTTHSLHNLLAYCQRFTLFLPRAVDGTDGTDGERTEQTERTERTFHPQKWMVQGDLLRDLEFLALPLFHVSSGGDSHLPLGPKGMKREVLFGKNLNLKFQALQHISTDFEEYRFQVTICSLASLFWLGFGATLAQDDVTSHGWRWWDAYSHHTSPGTRKHGENVARSEMTAKREEEEKPFEKESKAEGSLGRWCGMGTPNSSRGAFSLHVLHFCFFLF